LNCKRFQVKQTEILRLYDALNAKEAALLGKVTRVV
jgi:hypothetical protein